MRERVKNKLRITVIKEVVSGVKKMKMFFFAVFFFALFGSALAQSLNVPSSLPSNVNWSFSVDLAPTDSFDSAVVSLDSKKLLTVFPNGQITKDAFNGQFVLSAFLVDSDTATTSGLVLYVSVIGLEPGQHDLKAEVFKNGEITTAKNSLIDFFVPLKESFKPQFDSSILSIVSVTDSLKEKNKALEEKLLSIEGLIKETNTYLDEVDAKVKSELENMKAVLEEKKEDEAANQVPVSEDESALQQGSPSEQSVPLGGQPAQAGFSPLTGLANLAKGVSWLHVFLVLAIAAVVAVFVFRSRKKGDKWSGEIDDKLYQEE